MDILDILFILFIWGIMLLLSIFPGIILGSVFEAFLNAKLLFYVGFVIGAFAFMCFVGPFLPRINESQKTDLENSID